MLNGPPFIHVTEDLGIRHVHELHGLPFRILIKPTLSKISIQAFDDIATFVFKLKERFGFVK